MATPQWCCHIHFLFHFPVPCPTFANTSSSYQVFEKLLWKPSKDAALEPSKDAALEAERRCCSKVILESNVTPNMTRSSDCFSTVTPMVNGDDWGCIDLETIIVLFLLSFNFIHQRSHHSLTLAMSRIRDSAAVTVIPGDNLRFASKWHLKCGSDIWFKDDIWEASSLCFQNNFSQRLCILRTFWRGFQDIYFFYSPQQFCAWLQICT